MIPGLWPFGAFTVQDLWFKENINEGRVITTIFMSWHTWNEISDQCWGGI